MVSYAATPQPIDAFSRMNVELFNEKKIIGVPTGFQSFFGVGEGKSLWSPDSSVVDIEIMGRSASVKAIIEPNGKKLLIGQIPLEYMDLHIDCKNEKLIVNPESPDVPLVEIYKIL